MGVQTCALTILAVEDYIFALEWAQKLGGLDALVARANANAAALDKIVQERDWLDHLAADPASRSTTSVCLKFADAAVEGLDDNAQLALRSDEHTSELQSLMRISYAVF